MQFRIRHISNALLVACATTATFYSDADAAPLTIKFAGTVSTLIGDDNSHAFSENFSAGDAISGWFSFDTTAMGRFPQTTSLQDYDATFEVSLGAHKFGGQAYYRLFNQAAAQGGDGWAITTDGRPWSGPALGNLSPTNFFLQFVGMPEATLADTLILADPQALVPLADPNYAPHGFRLDDSVDGSWGGLYFTILNVTAVPEPGSWALTGLALALVALGRRHQRFSEQEREPLLA